MFDNIGDKIFYFGINCAALPMYLTDKSGFKLIRIMGILLMFLWLPVSVLFLILVVLPAIFI